MPQVPRHNLTQNQDVWDVYQPSGAHGKVINSSKGHISGQKAQNRQFFLKHGGGQKCEHKLKIDTVYQMSECEVPENH